MVHTVPHCLLGLRLIAPSVRQAVPRCVLIVPTKNGDLTPTCGRLQVRAAGGRYRQHGRHGPVRGRRLHLYRPEERHEPQYRRPHHSQVGTEIRPSRIFGPNCRRVVCEMRLSSFHFSFKYVRNVTRGDKFRCSDLIFFILIVLAYYYQWGNCWFILLVSILPCTKVCSSSFVCLCLFVCTSVCVSAVSSTPCRQSV